MKNTDEFEDEYREKSIGNIPNLLDLLKEVETDFPNWTTYYKSKVDDSFWAEEVVASGHGDTYLVRRVKDENELKRLREKYGE